MFEDAGSKIKKVASVLTVLEIIAFIIAALIFFASSDDRYSDKDLCIILGFSCLVAGPILAWIGNLLLYGFGELIEKTVSIEYTVKDIKKAQKTQTENDKKNAAAEVKESTAE